MNAEVMRKGEIGLCAVEKDDWKLALCELVSNTTMRERLGRTGRIVVQQFDTKLVATSLAAAIRSVI